MKPRLPLCTLLVGLALGLGPAPAHALRVVTYNLTNYDFSTAPARQPYLRTVFSNINADVIMVQELLSQAARDSFLLNVLGNTEPGQWTGTNYWPLSFDEGGAFFWRKSKVDTISFVSTITTGGPRQVLFGRVVPAGYAAIAGTFRLYSVHFKAGGPATADSATRRGEATSLRTTLNATPANTNFLVGGDTNIYGAYEGAYIRLTESQPDNDGRGTDVLSMPGLWNNASYAPNHSQCPCSGSGCPAGQGFSGGGLDDRFDLLLSSGAMNNGQGVEMVNGSYGPYGNDGQHYNDNVDGGGFNNAVGVTVAAALRNASDHLPVVATVQLASRLQVAASLPFGSVITGATAQQTLTVTDNGVAPLDALDYSMAAPGGFTAPGGPFSAAAGVGNNHTISMSTGSVGNKSGNLAVTSDDPDNLTRNVALGGIVLAHAIPSLDSASVFVEDSLRFGFHDIGSFTEQGVRIHDAGYAALQAQLAVTGGSITGPNAWRFSVIGGFSPWTIAGIGHTFEVHFDATGATADSTYEATLVFNTADEPLPGAAPRSDVTLHLTATITGSSADVLPGAGPSALAFLPPRPNPVPGETFFRFDLPRAMGASLDVFDLSGRRVARVVAGDLPAGRHQVHWSARDDQGRRLAGGLYFARFSAAGFVRTQRLVLLP